MKAAKKRKLEAAGWKISSADEFLALSPQESAYLDVKMAVAALVRERRQKSGKTQLEFAALTASSQSRVAKAESADASVSLDLLFRMALAVGATRKDLSAAVRA